MKNVFKFLTSVPSHTIRKFCSYCSTVCIIIYDINYKLIIFRYVLYSKLQLYVYPRLPKQVTINITLVQ